MRAIPFLAHYVAVSGMRRLPIQFFATSHKEAVRIAKRKAGKGLLQGLALSRVEPLSGDMSAAADSKKAA